MTRRYATLALTALLAGSLACASDVWFKPGAGPDALARDKSDCRRQEVPEDVDAEAAFEQCMTDRKWWHLARGGGRDVALRDGEVIETYYDPAYDIYEVDALPEVGATAPESGAPETASAGEPVPAAGAPPRGVSERTGTSGSGVRSETGAMPETGGTRESEEASPPAGPQIAQRSPTRTTAGGAPPRTVRPRPADPAKRQFWFKLGAGPGQLEVDQRACRTDMGLGPEADQPSRWGQSRRFDRCMREKGWLGGSIEAT